MTKFSKYRIIALGLAGVFSIFNIGLPIVLASCPMIKSTASDVSCCPLMPERRLVSFSVSNDYSCCTTIIAGERNTNEFLQAKENLNLVLQYSNTPVFQSVPIAILNRNQITFSFSDSSPPFVQDIPILLSSLLI